MRVSKLFYFSGCRHISSLLAAKVKPWALILLLILKFEARSQNSPVKKVKYHDDNRLAVKEIYFTESKKSSQKTGPYTSFYHSGIPRIKGNYSANQPEGCWERFFETGILKSSIQYKKGIMEGPASFYFENGKKAQSGFYRANQEDSIWNFYYESGRLKSNGYFKKGKAEGLWRYFHEDSTLKATAILQNGKGLYREYFASGLIKMEGLISGGQSDSIWKYFHENGVIKAIGHEKDGQRQGYWKFYFPNGNLSSEGHFRDNQKFGHWKYFHENGGLSSEGDLEKDAKEGIWKFYFPSGNLLGEGNFKGGSGDYREFYDNGKLKVKGRIENNLYEGNWTYYFEDGGLEGECLYQAGAGEFRGYYDNGALKMRGQMQNGQKVGSWDLMGRDGKLLGHYKTFYEIVQPAAELEKNRKSKQDTLLAKPKNLGKPEFMGNRRRSRHFIPKINELKGFIAGMNPFSLALGSIPASLEYFFHDRLGYELMFVFYRQPFFKVHLEDTEAGRVFTTGNSLNFRQKLYNQDRGKGSFYIGQEFRVSDFNYRLLVIDRIDSVQTNRRLVSGSETRFEASLLFGDRLFREYNRHYTLTMDIFAGIGFGYRISRIPAEMNNYKNFKINKLSIPVRLGFTLGYLF